MTVFLFPSLYRIFTTAYNIDGLSSFNRNELNVHGDTDSSTRIILIINMYILLLDRIKCHRSRTKEADNYDAFDLTKHF